MTCKELGPKQQRLPSGTHHIEKNSNPAVPHMSSRGLGDYHVVRSNQKKKFWVTTQLSCVWRKKNAESHAKNIHP